MLTIPFELTLWPNAKEHPVRLEEFQAWDDYLKAEAIASTVVLIQTAV